MIMEIVVAVYVEKIATPDNNFMVFLYSRHILYL